MPSLNTGNAILSNPIKVDSSYNVGIGGAASGSFKLQVTGTTNLTDALTGTSANFSGNNHSLASNNTLRFTDTDTATEANQQIGKIEFYSSDSSTPGAGVKAYIGAFAQDTTPDAYLSFATQDGSATPNPVERLRISSEGAATFSSSVTATSLILNGSATFTGTSGAFIGLTINNTDATGSARLRVTSTGGNINDFSSFSASHPSRANQAWLGGDGSSTVTVLQAGGVEFLRGTSTGAATFSSQVNAESFYTNDTRYIANQIMAGYNANSEDSDIWINYTGYQGGATRFRDFRIGNGKQGQIAFFDGSTSNVGIGTNSPGSILDVKGTGTYDFIKISNGSTSGGGGFLSYQNGIASSWFGNSGGWEGGTSNDTGIGSYAGGIRFYTNGGTEKMRITSGGAVQVGIGAAATNVNFNINGVANKAGRIQFMESGSPIWLAGNGAASENGRFEIYDNINGTGVQLLRGATSWTALSDERFKDIIEPISVNDKLKDIRAVIGKYKTDTDGIRRNFLIAQDLLKVFPEVVDVDEDKDKPMGVRYQDLIPVLVKAIQELNQTVQNQQQQINSLINR